ncbi:unnamed protein product [Clonostachys chloroleuca]|uniref:Kinesin light chain n=1 Tax=Clonostachys chloroleuca TaxID=1926264 RepID=A0AA35Q6Q4_9HYPO|nr:unnamed protein product [Clonostachys chloroleuca]
MAWFDIWIRGRLGKKHPDTLQSKANLALLHDKQGRYEEAQQAGLLLVEIMSRVLGEDHLDTLSTMGNLALTYNHQGRCGEAEALQKLVTQGTTRILGEEHAQTLTWVRDGQDRARQAGKPEVAGSLQESGKLMVVSDPLETRDQRPGKLMVASDPPEIRGQEN